MTDNDAPLLPYISFVSKNQIKCHNKKDRLRQSNKFFVATCASSFDLVHCLIFIMMVIFLFVFALQCVASSPMGGGKCETTADCVAPNVCSKWGWCQWTKIYGEDGPSQGADAPGKIEIDVFLPRNWNEFY